VAAFGIRFDLRNPAFSGASMAERVEAALGMAGWADQLGARLIVLVEHHGSEDGYLPSPLTLGAAVAARTRAATVRLFLNASFYDPLRLAEDLAILDLIGKGRIDVNLVAGYVPQEFAMFGVPMSERPARMNEVVATLRAAWTGEPFEFRGRTVRIRPTPYRPGGPPLTLGGSTEAAARRAARAPGRGGRARPEGHWGRGREPPGAGRSSPPPAPPPPSAPIRRPCRPAASIPASVGDQTASIRASPGVA